MPTFRIPLVATARVGTVMEVCADTLEDAQKVAIQIAKDGSAIWHYECLDTDDSIELGE